MTGVDYFDFQWQRPKRVLQLSPRDAQQFLHHPRGQWSTSNGKSILDAANIRSGLLLIPLNRGWEMVQLMNEKNTSGIFAVAHPSVTRICGLVGRYGRLRYSGQDNQEPEFKQDVPYINKNLSDSYIIEDIEPWIENMNLLYIAKRINTYLVGVIHVYDLRLELKYMESNEKIKKLFAESFENIPDKTRSALRDLTHQTDLEAEIAYRRFYSDVFKRIMTMKVSRVKVEISCSFEDTGNVRTHIVPQSLEDAIWLSFAQYVSGAAQMRQCVYCGRVYPHRGHKDRQYCSDACRQAASRLRRGL